MKCVFCSLVLVCVCVAGKILMQAFQYMSIALDVNHVHLGAPRHDLWCSSQAS